MSSKAPLDTILQTVTSKKGLLSWYGIPNFDDFFSYISPHLPKSPNQRNRIQRTLLQLRQGFKCRVAVPLLQPNISRPTFMKMFQETMEDLYKWATTEIYLLKPNDWRKQNTDRLNTWRSSFLFYFLDGTVLPIWSPGDVAKNKANFNTKHGCCAHFYYIIVAPDGRIVYVSLVDVGSTYDATPHIPFLL